MIIKNKEMDNTSTSIKIVKLITLILTIAAIIKLLIIAYYQHDGFSDMAYYQSSVTVTLDLPRGEIFDTNGIVLATNESSYSLEYVESGLISDERKDELAQVISGLIDIDEVSIYTPDVKDYILSSGDNFTTVLDMMSDEDYAVYSDETNTTVAEQNEILRSYITDEQVEDLIESFGEEALYIRLLMEQSTTKAPVEIARDLTIDEVYAIETNSSKIGGFYVTDAWERVYPQKELLSGFLGTLGPIPEEDQDYYQTLGYNINEEVGVSFAEEALEPILHSSPATLEVYFDEDGNIINTEVIDEGTTGYDVVLTLDSKLQKASDDAIKEQLADNSYAYNTNSCSAGIDPDTGFLLFSSGIQEASDEGEYLDYSTCSFTFATEFGSVLKPAALLTLYDQGILEHGEVIYDEPLFFQGSPEKSSWQNMGSISDKEAIARSSNVYFYKAFIEMAGQTYVKNGPLDISSEYFELVRKSFSQFGLGISTGINMPYENEGLQGTDYQPGYYLDLANGQYDTYTTLQATQYLSTISNGGTRYKVQYVKSINEPGSAKSYGNIVYETKPVALNGVTMTDDDLEYVKEAMHGVTTQSYGTMYLLHTLEDKYDVEIGSKSGTAENFYYDVESETLASTTNCSAFSYFPLEDPDIAISVISPYCAPNNDQYNYMNKYIAYDITEYLLERDYSDD